jgi:hypothetical protein
MRERFSKKSIGTKDLAASSRKRSSVLNTSVTYCGGNLEQLKKLPDTR